MLINLDVIDDYRLGIGEMDRREKGRDSALDYLERSADIEEGRGKGARRETRGENAGGR